MVENSRIAEQQFSGLGKNVSEIVISRKFSPNTEQCCSDPSFEQQLLTIYLAMDRPSEARTHDSRLAGRCDPTRNP
jgi:hypothetical protein